MKYLVLALLSLGLMGASSCNPVPDNEPMLNVPQPDGTCASYKLVDKTNLTYQQVGYVPCESVLGGYCLPKGEFEKILAYARAEIKQCSASEAEERQEK